jgi:hypothetical protein
MKVKELIEQLKTLNPDLYVFTKGYEGGYEDIEGVNDIKDITLDYNTEVWYGPHELTEEKHKEKYTIVKGVIL